MQPNINNVWYSESSRDLYLNRFVLKITSWHFLGAIHCIYWNLYIDFIKTYTLG